MKTKSLKYGLNNPTGGIMKKKMIMVLVLAVAILTTPFLTLADSSSQDYKVIKKAMKTKKKSGDVTWFRVQVTNLKTGKNKVMIKIPVSLIELIAECSDDAEDFNINGKCKVNLKQVLTILKKHSPQALVEVQDEEEGEHIKIWFE
jgi:hypothetical protein